MQRTYEVYVVLGSIEFCPLWYSHAWLRAAEVLNPLIQACRKPITVTSAQRDRQSFKWLKFRRLGWNEADHRKWTWEVEKQDVEFGWTDIRSRTSRGDTPDLFLEIRNADAVEGDDISQFLLVAVANDLEFGRLGLIVDELSQMMGFLYRVRQHHRPYVLFLKENGALIIQDLLTTGLFKKTPRKKQDIWLSMFTEDAWEPW